MPTSYWIVRPDGMAFISAFSPEGVGQMLGVALDWPAGSYVIRTHRHGASGTDDPRWGRAVRAENGGDWIEAADEIRAGD